MNIFNILQDEEEDSEEEEGIDEEKEQSIRAKGYKNDVMSDDYNSYEVQAPIRQLYLSTVMIKR